MVLSPPPSEFSVGSGGSVKGALARTHVFTAFLEKAQQEGIEIGQAWDGTTPPFQIGGYAVGWVEAVRCLYDAAAQSRSRRGIELTNQLVEGMARVVPTIVTVEAARRTLGNRASGRLNRLHNTLGAIRRSIAVVGVYLKRAHALAVEAEGGHVLLNDPVFLSKVFNICLTDLDTWGFLEDFNTGLYAYNTSYIRWVRS